MKIPKKIHYCWFGNNSLPDIALRCMESWRKYCPDYEIIQWDETNVNLNSCQFVKEAYSEKKWAFVSDYIRLKVIGEYGGIYLDIDVELIKPLDDYLNYEAFMGFEQSKPYRVNTGLGFGAIPNHPVIIKLIKNYERSSFILSDGSFDMTPCPRRDSVVLTELGLLENNSRQRIMGVEIFPYDFFCPISLLGHSNLTSSTVSIHHYNASWLSDASLERIQKQKKAISRYGPRLGAIINFMYTCQYLIEVNGFKGTLIKLINKL